MDHRTDNLLWQARERAPHHDRVHPRKVGYGDCHWQDDSVRWVMTSGRQEARKGGAVEEYRHIEVAGAKTPRLRQAVSPEPMTSTVR